jgi:caffeoyl-CoA O-methyltransferase
MNIIHPDIENYALQHTSPESSVLGKLNRETNAKILRPRMLSGHMQGKLLEMISCMLQPAKILEIGTYTGYSAICLAKGLQQGGIIHTIDHNAELEDFARRFFEEAGLTDVIRYHMGEALDILPAIDEVFDLIFIDADKENYITYYNLAIEKTRSGGIIMADNVLWSGKVLQDIVDEETRSIKEFNEFVMKDSRVENIMLPFRDGLSLIRKL